MNDRNSMYRHYGEYTKFKLYIRSQSNNNLTYLSERFLKREKKKKFYIKCNIKCTIKDKDN